MSFRLREEEEAFEASSCGYSSGGDSGDEGDRFPDSADHRRQPAPPPLAPLRRMNSDSIYDMSGMTAHLPAKKGLSMYYQGKSQSFASMTEVRGLEDLQKKDKPPPRKMKPCKSYAALGGIMAGGKPAAAATSCAANLGLMAAGNGFRNIPLNEHCYHQ